MLSWARAGPSSVADTPPRLFAHSGGIVNHRTYTNSLDDLDELDREHVTLHVYQHPDRNFCRWVDPLAFVRHPELRLTLDYLEDYTLFRKLFQDDSNPGAEQAIERMLADPTLAAINSSCRQKTPR